MCGDGQGPGRVLVVLKYPGQGTKVKIGVKDKTVERVESDPGV